MLGLAALFSALGVSPDFGMLLMLLVGYQLLRLRRNLRRGVFGSRLAVRLVFLFALVAGAPGALAC